MKGQLAAAILDRCRAAHEQVNACLETGANSGGAKLVAWLAKNKKSLELTDTTFSVEIAFFSGRGGC